jgi:hypothetical protein
MEEVVYSWWVTRNKAGLTKPKIPARAWKWKCHKNLLLGTVHQPLLYGGLPCMFMPMYTAGQIPSSGAAPVMVQSWRPRGNVMWPLDNLPSQARRQNRHHAHGGHAAQTVRLACCHTLSPTVARTALSTNVTLRGVTGVPAG